MALSQPCLMLVTDRSRCGGVDGLIAVVEEAVQGGVDAVQLREKDLPPEELRPLARRMREVTFGRALLLVNGPLDVALATPADGVHLPESAPLVRRPQEGFLVGRSVHSVDAARRAMAEGADYLIAGPVYETASHPGRDPAGPSLIEEVTVAVTVPVLAIGGINAARIEQVVRAGASGVAVISAVLDRPDSRAAAAELRLALDAAWAAAGAVRP
jgi:thiamine-phosphate diphosphorylase